MKRFLFIALASLMAFTSGCGFVQTSLAETPTPTPTTSYKITRDEAIAIASQYVPPDIAKNSGISAGIGQGSYAGNEFRTDPSNNWGVLFIIKYITPVTKDQLGWQSDNKTDLSNPEPYNTIYVRIDAMTGELLYRTEYYADYLGGPIPTGPILEQIISPSSLQPNFSWLPYQNATEYEFILATDPALTNVIIKTNLPGTSYQLAFDLQPGTTYFWAVRASKPTPGIQSFATFTTTTSQFTIDILWQKPVGSYPNEGHMVDGRGMTLYYNASQDAPNKSNISGAALDMWPVFYASTILVSPGAQPNLSAKLFYSIRRDDGNAQTTWDGYPLYYYARDQAPGDTLGLSVGSGWNIFTFVQPIPITMPGQLFRGPQPPLITVLPPPTTLTTNWWLISGSIAGGVIIVGLIVALLVLRKRSKSNTQN